VRATRLSRPLVLILFSSSILVASSSPAFAACSFDKDNDHVVSGITHGWDRFFCQPANNYNYDAFTNHGHGDKYAALWHSDASHIHCDDIGNGSVNAFCSATVPNTHHETFHDAPLGGCLNRYGDGHGIDCHDMEALP
jgi:hypothetical protein